MRFTDTFLDDIRDRISISEVVGTRVDFDRKKSKSSRGDFWGCCPFHAESSPSFHCEDRKGRYHCFGCGASGDHFRFISELDGVSFPRAVEIVAGLAGVSLPDSRPETAAERAERERRERDRARKKEADRRKQEQDDAAKAETVKEIWHEAVPITGTLAEKYLLGRGIAAMTWPPSVRFHHGLWFGRDKHPALIAGVQNVARRLVAVWRIPLTPHGKAITGPDGRKVKLGLGPAGGGAVRLGPAGDTILVCEGLETGFGVGNLTKWKHPVWPLLSTSGMIGWEPPEGVRRVQIYSDGDRYKVRPDGTIGDPPGRVAAEKLNARLIAMGIEVVILEPPAGTDWLDVWVSLQNEERRARDVEYIAD